MEKGMETIKLIFILLIVSVIINNGILFTLTGIYTTLFLYNIIKGKLLEELC